jgi:cytidine deaminase
MIRNVKMIHEMAADLNNDFRFKIVAAIFLKNKPVSFGYCHLKSHPFQASYAKNDDSIYWHAETYAIFNSLKRITKKDLEKATLIVARSKENGQFGIAKPCCGCVRCISDYKIKKVVYTLDDPYNKEYAIIDNR